MAENISINEFSDVNDIPLPIFSRDKGSTGYNALKYRLPEILTKIIDLLNKYACLLDQTNNAKCEDVLEIMSNIVKLRHHLMKSEEFSRISDKKADNLLWNNLLDHINTYDTNKKKCWTNCPFLFSECYYYRQLYEIFQNSKFHRDFDYFFAFKKDSFITAEKDIKIHAKYTQSLLASKDIDKKSLIYLLLHSLFCNKLDLSLSSGNPLNSDIFDEFDRVKRELMDNLLINDIERVCSYLFSLDKESPRTIHIVVDNAGLEFFSDICLVLYLLSAHIASTVVIHLKCYPWLVSDFTYSDLDFFMKFLSISDNKDLESIKESIEYFLAEGSLKFTPDISWNHSLYYSDLLNVWDPFREMYEIFKKSSLVIFKGDLNYRRLTGELQWKYNTSLSKALGNFVGFPLLILRIIKSDCVVGLDEEIISALNIVNKNWKQTGEKAIVCFVPA
ncbi:hypothetical protein HZS_5666 [Henneguya salminicola]|nr:hypothetical protein HZS_5666 [Henneguya salminicola]